VESPQKKEKKERKKRDSRFFFDIATIALAKEKRAMYSIARRFQGVSENQKRPAIV
jgi:hypothetical protein